MLQYLAEGFSPEEVYRDVVTERRPATATSADRDSLEMAILNTTSRITLVTSPDELADILDKPFAAWRVFLHPSQRRVAYRVSYNGPAQVSGGPGTGKTVVALHRVKHLLSRSPDSRVLLTTFTNALAGMLRENLALLLDDEEQLARVQVTTIDAFANRVVREVTGRPLSPITDADELQLWRRVCRRHDLPWTEQFLAQEYRHVILAQQVTSKEDYLPGRAARPRFGVARTAARTALARRRGLLGRAARRGKDDASAGLRATRRSCSARTPPTTASTTSSSTKPRTCIPRSGGWCAPPSPEGPDDLFITGDPHQRIYDSRVSLRSLGISVAGRSSRLRINYRSTAEILGWSTGLLDGSLVEELGGDGADTLAGYRSLLHGTRPDASGYPAEHAEITALVERVQDWVGQGILPSEIAVCTRFNILLDKVHDRLTAEGIPAVRVKDRPGPEVDGVRLASMHVMKGLEFRCVAVAASPHGPCRSRRRSRPRTWTASSTRTTCSGSAACCSSRAPAHGKPSPSPGAGRRARSSLPLLGTLPVGSKSTLGEAVPRQRRRTLTQLRQVRQVPFELVERSERGAVPSLIVDAHLRNARTTDIGAEAPAAAGRAPDVRRAAQESPQVVGVELVARGDHGSVRDLDAVRHGPARPS